MWGIEMDTSELRKTANEIVFDYRRDNLQDIADKLNWAADKIDRLEDESRISNCELGSSRISRAWNVQMGL